MFDLNELKGLDLQRPNVEELLYLAGCAKMLHAEYDARSLEAPEWLDARIREIKREITSRQADAIDKRKREVKAHLAQLETPAEKRAKLQAELEKLESVGA